MPTQWTMIKPVEFVDTDRAGVVHFANFFRYMEAAEHAFCRAVGIPVYGAYSGRALGWPRVHAQCDYKQAARFGDELQIVVTVDKKSTTTVQYRFQFYRLHTSPLVEIATGSLIVACALLDPATATMEAIPIPDEILAKL